MADNETRALILAKETGAVDNAGLRATTGLDTLSASEVFKRLQRSHRLLEQGGAGSATYYRLADRECFSGELPLFPNEYSNTGDPAVGTGELPADLQARLEALTPKARKDRLWPIIVWLCMLQPRKAEQIAGLLAGNTRGQHVAG